MLTLLAKNKSFRYLWIGQLISALGDRLTQMGILAFVMISSHDKGDKVALITFFSLLPSLLFGPLFGALVDRYSRKKMMILADVLRAVLVLLIPVIWINTHSVGLIIAWFFLLGALTALFTPAKMSIITDITEKDVLLEANSMIVTTGMVATLVGTLIAGALIKITGVQAAFFINSLTYLLSALFILRIVYQKTERPSAGARSIYPVLAGDIKTGIGYIRRHRIVFRLILLHSVFAFISSFAYILILNYGTTILKRGPFGIGCLLSAAGFGMIAGSLILLKRKDKVNYARALYLSFLIIGVFCALFFLNPTFYWTFAVLFCAGIGAAVATITMDTLSQRLTPDDLKGKIFAAQGLLTTSVFLLSLLLVGFLIKHIQVTVLFVITGTAAILTALRVFLSAKRWGYQLLCLTMRLVMKLYFGYSVTGIENLPKTKRVILAGNHTSVIDGIALAAAYPGRVYFLAADTAFKTRFFGWCLKRLGYISIKRGGFNKEAIKQAIAIIKSGYSIGIFPEGKIACDGRLSAGKEGIALIARLAHAEIIPFAIEGAYEAWPLPNKYPRRFPVSVKFGKPIDLKDYPLPEELVNEVMQDISRLKLDLEREGYLRVDPDEIIKYLIG